MSVSTIKLNASNPEGFKTIIKASHEMIIDQPQQAGGTNEGANPLEYFLSSLPGCICAIGRIIANQKKMPIKSISVDVEADIDKDFLLGKTLEGRAGFIEIRANVKVDGDISLEEKKLYLEEIEKRCPIADNIENKTKVVTKIVD